jgi:two-component system chemotaxis response regulator CheY
MKMLIVDDSKAMRNYLQGLAAELSFQTEEAEDGRAGLQKLIRNDPRDPFAVALVDWEMPVMNGLELVRTVRRNRDFSDLKLMMVTTGNALEQVAVALEAGADDYLMKPVTRELLAEKLQILGVV